MTTELLVSLCALLISVITASFLFFQVLLNSRAIKAQVFVSIFNDIHEDVRCQETLSLIYQSLVSSVENCDLEKCVLINSNTNEIITHDIDRLLEKFQILGQLYELKVLHEKNLKTLAYEVIVTGRDPHIRKYLKYLDTKYVEQSGVKHSHFLFFKKLYLVLETSEKIKQSFQLEM